MKKAIIFGTLGIQIVSLGLSIYMLKNPEKYGELVGRYMNGFCRAFEED